MAEATPVPRFFYLRCVVDSDETALVESVAERLTRSVAPDTAVVELTIEPYTKFPGTTEIYMDLDVVPELARVHGAVRDRLGSGWNWEMTDGDTAWYTASSVWNRVEGATFVDPHVRWAHLECRTENP